MANEKMTKLDANQVLKAVYNEEEKRLKVDALVTASITELQVIIDAASGDNLSIADKDGNNFLNVNPDGSIDANTAIDSATGDNIAIKSTQGNELYIDPTGSISARIVETYPSNFFYQVTNLAVGASQSVIDMNIPADTVIVAIEIGGDNVSRFNVTLAATPLARKYLSYTNFESTIEFKPGLYVPSTQRLIVEVLNESTTPGNFYARLLLK